MERLGNALDVDLKITWLQNVQSKYIWMKKVIVHATTTKIIVTEKYMHLWHKCLAMTNGKIMVRLENWDRTLVQEGWQKKRIVYGTRVLYDYNWLSLGIDSISLNVRRTWKLSIRDENNVVLNENSVEGKPCINRESKSDELII